MTVTVTALIARRIAWGKGYKWDRVKFHEFDAILTRVDTFLLILTLFDTLACSKFQERVFSELFERLRQARHLSASGGSKNKNKQPSPGFEKQKHEHKKITVLELSW